eukprot:gnl/MRDRNA2_/MRDRNA2_200582_c0_seq1.p1 gnl/MRDRNA2_/MRDRNA2_200582_c0~~gnl/MRDRNA2_/MRDRNA2_200582_c0_seq1.p1  ORF type:complete len:114 (+),score=27.90 gnl/MRDRNA2_/MRDRNA2_200582_c0_seq1:91-432(+)
MVDTVGAPQQEAMTNDVDAGISGQWVSTKVGPCACGYNGVHMITMTNEEVTIEELKGSCCGCVPNLIKGKVQMKKSDLGKWEGTSGFKSISLTKISDTQLEYLSTDGMLKLTR